MMRKLLGGGLIAAAMLCATGAQAQSFTYEITWGDVAMVGGIGPDGTRGRGGTVSGTYVTTFDDDTTSTGTVTCVGMGQAPSANVFDIVLSCDAVDSDTTALAYGCNYLGAPGPDTALGCVGGMRASDGETEGRVGSVTMHWNTATTATGTGQWY
jgi:hypothetical protein